MEIIIVNKRSEFSNDQIEELEKLGKVIFYEDSNSWDLNKDKLSNEEKIIAIDPGISNWKLENEDIDKIKNIKAVCIPTTRYNWIDGEYLKSKNIVLTNVPKYSTESVAEHCIFLMLSIVKKIPLIIKNDWKLDYDKHLGYEVNGKNAGIIGLGDIGTRVADLCSNMGMNVMYWSKNTRNEKYKYMELKDLVKNSDVLFLAVRECDETKDMFNKELIDLMKEESFIVNIVGNSVWDFEYLLEKLKENKIEGVGIDEEDLFMENYEGNIMITPHIAWYTKDAFKEDFRIWVESIKSCINNNPKNKVN